MRAVIFDLDGTLVDTVYGHTLAWQQVLAETGTPLEGWKIHRLIGMSGGLYTLWSWEQGLMVAPGNPLGIGGVADLRRPDVRLVNREEGAGSRLLLDAWLDTVPVSGRARQSCS